MLVKTGGYSDPKDNYWINTDYITRIMRFTDGRSGYQIRVHKESDPWTHVTEPEGVAALEKYLDEHAIKYGD